MSLAQLKKLVEASSVSYAEIAKQINLAQLSTKKTSKVVVYVGNKTVSLSKEEAITLKEAAAFKKKFEAANINLSKALNSLVQAMQSASLSVEEFSNTLQRFTKTQKLIQNQCKNCSYYHGQNRIVCALHPEGNDNCSDYQKNPAHWRD